MKKFKKFYLFLLCFMFPCVINAASLSVNMECPKAVVKNSDVVCNVYATQKDVVSINANYTLSDFTYKSQTMNDNTNLTTPKTFTSESFSVGNTNGLPSYFKIGTVTFTAPNKPGVYKLGLNTIKGKDELSNDVNASDVFSSIHVVESNTNIKDIEKSKYSPFRFVLLYEDGTLFINDSNIKTYYVSNNVEKIVYVYDTSIWYAKEDGDLYYYNGNYGNEYMLMSSFGGGSLEDNGLFIANGNLYHIEDSAHWDLYVYERKLIDGESCHVGETFNEDKNVCYDIYVSSDIKVVTTDVNLLEENYYTDSSKNLYKYDIDKNKSISLNIGNVKEIKMYNNTLFILDENNDLYAYGENIFGKKVNAGAKIESPLKIVENVKEYNNDYALTYDKVLYTWLSNSNRITSIATNVDSVSKYDNEHVKKYFAYMVGEKSYLDEIKNNDSGILTANHLVQFDGEILYFCDTWSEIYLTDSKNDLYYLYYTAVSKNFTKIASNVKKIDVIDVYDADVNFLTTDGEVYSFISSNNKSLILDNILYVIDDGFYISKDGKIYDSNINYGEFSYNEIFYETGETINSNLASFSKENPLEINLNQHLDLNVTIYPLNSTTKNVMFTSSDETVVSTTEDGFITALKPGTATITVTTLDTLKQNSIEVSVLPIVNEIKLTDSKGNVVESLKIKTNTENNSSQSVLEDDNDYKTKYIYLEVLPETAVNKDLTVTSSDESILKVYYSSYNKNMYFYTYGKTGNVIITFKNSNGDVVKKLPVEVYDVFPEEIFILNKNFEEIDGKHITASGKNGTFTSRGSIYIQYDDDEALEKVVTITSNDEDKAKVSCGTGTYYLTNDDGKKYRSCSFEVGNKTGDVTLTASTNNGVSKTITLHIDKKINFTPLVNNITLDKTYDKTYKINLTGDAEFDDSIFTYEVANNGNDIISVSEDGTITALNEGYTAVIVYTKNTLSGRDYDNYIYVTVTDYENSTVKPLKTYIELGESNEDYVTINWDLVKYASEYQVYRSTDGDSFTKVATTSAKTYVDNSVKAGYTYYYKVRAINDIGSGSFSSVISYKIPLGETSLEISGVTYNSIKLAWEQVSDVTGYQIYRSTSATSGFKKIKSITSYKTTSYTNTSLSNGVKYYYKIRTYKTVNGKTAYGSFSDVIYGSPRVGETTLKVSKDTSTSLKLSWSKVSGATGYQVYKCVDEECTKVKSTTSTSYTVTGLSLGNEYTFALRAYRNADGKTSYGEYVYESGVVAPGKTSITIGDTTNTSIDLSLKKVSGATHYLIQYKTSEEEEYTSEEVTSLEYSLENLIVGKTYNFRVYALANVDEDVVTSNVYKLDYVLKPDTPTGLKTVQESFGNIKISWKSDESITKYKIYRSTSKSSGYKALKTVVDANEFIDTDVLPNKTYYYKIRAYAGSTYSDYSSVKSVKNTFSTPKITLASNSYNSIKISINEVDGAIGYQIYRATSKSGKYTKVKTTSLLEYINSSLTFNKNYYYKVRAYVKVDGETYYSSYSTIKYTKPVLSTPTLEVENTIEGNLIKISKVSGASKYLIYRKTNDGSYEKLVTITDLEYLDDSIIEGNTYTYKVKAYKKYSSKDYYSNYSLEQ